MDNKEMEKNELNLKEMEQVAGGGQYADSDWARCWLGCKGPTFTSKTVNGHYYRGQRCEDCGHEYYMKDGSRISPHEYYQAVHSVKVGIEEQDD